MNLPKSLSINSALKNVVITLSVIFSLLIIYPFGVSAQPYGLVPDYETNTPLVHQLSDDSYQIRLIGVTTYEAGEIFHQLLVSTPGVSEAKRTFFRLVPSTPQACLISWRVTTDGIDGFELESRLQQNLQNYIDHTPEAIPLTLPFSAVQKDLELLAKIQPYSATSRSLIFASIASGPLSSFENEQYWGNSPYNWLPQNGFE